MPRTKGNRMKKLILTIACFISVGTSLACINEYRTLLSGKVIKTEPTSGRVWTTEIDSLALKQKATERLAYYTKTGSIEHYSDYAAALIYLDDYEKAKQIYIEIEKKSPNLYTTASNLGTLYELLGQPKEALFWIKKSIQINPKSHMGSEWIHVKILEQKIARPTSFKFSILQLDFGTSSIPSNPKGYDLMKLQQHIWHQLRERTTFVKPKNLIVGNIYFDLGNVLAQTTDVQAALESYAAAKEYGFESELMEQRIDELEVLALKAKPNQLLEDLKDSVSKNPMFYFLGIIGLSAFGLYRWISKKKD